MALDCSICLVSYDSSPKHTPDKIIITIMKDNEIMKVGRNKLVLEV